MTIIVISFTILHFDKINFLNAWYSIYMPFTVELVELYMKHIYANIFVALAAKVNVLVNNAHKWTKNATQRQPQNISIRLIWHKYRYKDRVIVWNILRWWQNWWIGAAEMQTRRPIVFCMHNKLK